MAEGEATVRAASDGGEGTGVRMVGGSLPPRKRLLAGLKQNGSWSASSSRAPATVLTVGHRPEGGGPLTAGTVSASSSSPSKAVTGEAKGGCTSCGTLESNAWRKTKRNGVPQLLCDVCYVSYNKNLQCPRCQGVYPDVKDPSVWLECSRCQRSVHSECEQRAPQLNAGLYMCPDCVQVKKDEEHGNSSTGAPSSRPGFNCDTEAGNHTLSSATECPTPSDKKPRVSREPRGKTYDVEVADASNFEEIPNSTKILLARKGSTSKEAAAAAAAAAAVLAGRVAAAAKASAAAKAATAVKAAAMAKAALDAAAVAARVEAQVRADLRKNLVSSQRTTVGDVKLDVSMCQLRKESAEETEVKLQAVTSLSSIDDEELARQLHRAINSSPRISSGLSPLRRKPSTKPAVIVNVSQAVTSFPRFGLSAESEPRLQMKQQQTRPRSLQLKEVKRFDFREVKLEPKPFGASIRAKVSQLHCVGASGNSPELLALKSEPAYSSTVTLVRQDSGNMLLQGAKGTPLNVATKTENGLMNRSTAVLRGLEDSQDRALSATDVSQAAALLDEVLSEADEDEASKEEYLSRLRHRPDVHLKGDLDALSRTIIEGPAPCTQPRLSEEEGRESNDGGGTANVNMSSVAALVQVASSAMELLENQDTSGSADGTWPAGRDNALEDGSTVKKFGHITAKASLSISVESSGAASGFETSSELESVPQPSTGKEWEQVVLNEVSRSGQAFAGGVHAGSFSSALAIRPNLNSGSAARHS